MSLLRYFVSVFATTKSRKIWKKQQWRYSLWWRDYFFFGVGSKSVRGSNRTGTWGRNHSRCRCKWTHCLACKACRLSPRWRHTFLRTWYRYLYKITGERRWLRLSEQEAVSKPYLRVRYGIWSGNYGNACRRIYHTRNPWVRSIFRDI